MNNKNANDKLHYFINLDLQSRQIIGCGTDLSPTLFLGGSDAVAAGEGITPDVDRFRK